MFKFSDILGTLMQSGMSGSTTSRIKNALGAGGGSQGGSLGGGGGVGDMLSGLMGGGKGGGIGGMLQNVLGDAGKALGGGNKLALGGLGALAGALLGGGGRSVKGALGGGAMAMLGALAFSAFKGTGKSAKAEDIPVGLRQPENAQQEEELEQEAELVLKGMINAAKADGKIDAAEIQRILGKLKEAGAEADARDFIIGEMNKPMDLESIVAATKGRPQLAAPIYAASLLAIEVDTPAERQYMQRLGDGLGLAPEVAAHIEKTIGV